MTRTATPLVGILGGIASGKSLLTDELARHGAAVVSADRLAHEVLQSDEVKRAARERWGDAIFSTDGRVDRAALAKIVFAPEPDGPRERKLLEQWTHPRIGELAREQIERLVRDASHPAIVLDVPLLLESGWHRWCDKLIFVDAPRQQRLLRAQTRGWTEEDFDRREAAQAPLEEKRNLADLVIDNSGSLAETQTQLDRFWQSLLAPSPHP